MSFAAKLFLPFVLPLSEKSVTLQAKEAKFINMKFPIRLSIMDALASKVPSLCTVLSFLHLFTFSLFAEEVLDPVADPAAVVTSGNARFTVLTSRMIRIQYSATAQFEDRATFAIVNRRLPVPEFTTETTDGYLYIRTEDVELRYKEGSVFKAADKKPDNLMVTFQMNGRNVIWYPGKDDSMNLLGTNRTLDQAWGDNKRGNLEKGLLSRAGWSIIDESPATTRGDGSTTYAFEPKEDGITWWANPVDKTAIDWYFLGYGHEYKACLGDYIKVGGRVPMPPKYILGYWYSRYWAYTQAEFQQIVRDVESYDIPMDVLIMDMDWHKSGWTGWSWNTNRIPNPKGLINYMHQHGLKTALNLHPSDGVSTKEDYYKAMAADLGDTSGQTLLWKVEDYDYMKALFQNVIRPHEQEGVDFWWLDWQQALTVGKHGQEKSYTPAEGSETLGETFWCNHTFFQDMQKNRPELRPVIYHRWGGLGVPSYVPSSITVGAVLARTAIPSASPATPGLHGQRLVTRYSSPAMPATCSTTIGGMTLAVIRAATTTRSSCCAGCSSEPIRPSSVLMPPTMANWSDASGSMPTSLSFAKLSASATASFLIYIRLHARPTIRASA